MTDRAQPLQTAELTRRMKQQAHQLGFDLVGVAPAVQPAGFHRLVEWLQRGYAGQMHYLEDRQSAYQHPQYVLEGVRSLFVVAHNYQTCPPRAAQPGQGRVSRYAWGPADYHDVMRRKLQSMSDWLKQHRPEARTRAVVDTAPLLEREFATLAGIGWVGKHTLVLDRAHGSWFFLAALLTDLQLEYDQPSQTDHCGSCRACLDACPTDAFPEPYVLDATRCISYLTIELQGPIPHAHRHSMGDWLFGCDVCQEVCPWNRKAPVTDRAEYQPRLGQNPVELLALFELTDEAFRERFRHTPLWRARRRGLLRSAAIILGNQRYRAAQPALIRALADPEAMVRGACAWALGELATRESHQALRARLAVEDHAGVQAEITAALGV